MRTAVQPVKGIAVNGKSVFMGDRGKVQKTIGAAGYGGMHQNGVFKAFYRDNVRGAQAFQSEFYR